MKKLHANINTYTKSGSAKIKVGRGVSVLNWYLHNTMV